MSSPHPCATSLRGNWQIVHDPEKREAVFRCDHAPSIVKAPMHWFAFSVVLVCLFVSAFFAASETALTGASRASMLRLSKQGNRQAMIVSKLLDMRERLIGALLLGNNIANIGASALATGIFTAWFGEVGVLYATAVMTALVVIFAEVLPKTIAINAPDRVSLAVARPMRATLYVLG